MAANQASRPWNSPGKNTGVGCHFLLQCMKVKSESEVAQSCPTLATPWTAAHQAPPSTGFSRQKYWSGVPLPSPAALSNIPKKEFYVLGRQTREYSHPQWSWRQWPNPLLSMPSHQALSVFLGTLCPLLPLEESLRSVMFCLMLGWNSATAALTAARLLFFQGCDELAKSWETQGWAIILHSCWTKEKGGERGGKWSLIENFLFNNAVTCCNTLNFKRVFWMESNAGMASVALLTTPRAHGHTSDKLLPIRSFQPWLPQAVCSTVWLTCSVTSNMPRLLNPLSPVEIIHQPSLSFWVWKLSHQVHRSSSSWSTTIKAFPFLSLNAKILPCTAAKHIPCMASSSHFHYVFRYGVHVLYSHAHRCWVLCVCVYVCVCVCFGTAQLVVS